MTLAGSVQDSPAGAFAVKVTTPVKPLTAVTVIVEVPADPAFIVAGLTAPALIVKSTTWNMMLAVVLVLPLLVPLTVTV